MSDYGNIRQVRAKNVQPQQSRKLRWKTTFSGNSSLSYRGLKVTVFQNARSGWSVSVVQNNGAPDYYNFQDKNQACAAAEELFSELKASGKFLPPKMPTCREALDGFLHNGRLPTEYSNQFVEREVWLERDADKANLFGFFEDGNFYWVPHSQFVLTKPEGHSRSILIVTRWWYDRRVPVLC